MDTTLAALINELYRVSLERDGLTREVEALRADNGRLREQVAQLEDPHQA